jgi:hypothetical protein
LGGHRGFSNCFPEWREYEEYRAKKALYTAMDEYHYDEKDRALLWPLETTMDDEGYIVPDEEYLIASGNWRGFPFEDLWNQNPIIPRRVIKRFAQDYCQWQERRVAREKEIIKRHGLFGRKRDDDDRLAWKWMMSDRIIRPFIESKNGRIFRELVRYLESHRMNRQQGEPLAERFGFGGKDYAVTQVDSNEAARYLTKQDALQNINISPQKVYRLIRWMADHELIVKLGKPGPREHTAYAIGKWFSYPDPVTGKMRPGGVTLFISEKNKSKLLRAIVKNQNDF